MPLTANRRPRWIFRHTAAVAGLSLVSLLAFAGAPARAARLDLPVHVAGDGLRSPFYQGDALEIRLAPRAASLAHPRAAGPTRAGQVLRLGVPSVDAIGASLGGVTFEPEFRGEVAPEPGAVAPPQTDFTAFQVVHLPPGASLSDALDRFRASPDVLSADPIATLPVSSFPNDSLFQREAWLYQSHLPRHDIRASEAWDVEQGDSSIVVGVIDTGIIPYSPDLGGTVAGLHGNMYVNWREAGGLPGVDDDGNGFVDDVSGWDFVDTTTSIPQPGEDGLDADNDPNDFVGHGTAVAGIIGALTNNTIGMAGVAPNVRLMPLRIGWQPFGAGFLAGDVSMLYAAQAIRYATRMGVQVLNCSFTSLNLSGLDAAVTAATRAGVVIVNAAGNGSVPAYLGMRDDVIAVTGVDSTDVVQGFSLTGPWVDLAADALALVSTCVTRTAQDSLDLRVPAYKGFLSGTSFAAPQVAGAVALMQAQRLHRHQRPLSPASVLLRLDETVDDISAENPGETGYGAGRLNVYRALTDPPGSFALTAGARTVGPPVVLHFNTGAVQVIWATSDQHLLALDGTSNDTVWVAPMGFSASGSLAAAPLGDGNVGLFVGTTNGRVLGFREDGSPLPGWPRVAAGGAVPMNAGVVLGDLDGDGLPEVICGANNGVLYAWHANGAPLPNFPFNTGTIGMGTPALADLMNNGHREIVFVGGDSQVHAVDSLGSEVAGWPVPAPTGAAAPVFARLGHAGAPNAVIVAGVGAMIALNGDGTTRWTQSFAGTTAQPPVLGDLDGDGVDEILLALGGPSSVSVFDSSGTPFARQGWPLALALPPAGPLLVGPVRAGHRAGIAFYTGTGIAAYDDSAQVIAAFPKRGNAGLLPALGDFDGDGATEIAAGSAAADSSLYTYDAGVGTWDPTQAFWPTERGNDMRTASRADAALATIDAIRPARVTDLVASALTATSVRVRWTTTGDDSLLGRAARVELRSSESAITEANFAQGTLWPTAAPDSSGHADSLDVTGLVEGGTYWFALRTFDKAGHASAVSNADTVQLYSAAPSKVTDLRVTGVTDSTVALAWTATGEDARIGRPAIYTLVASETVIDSAAFAVASHRMLKPASVDAGGTETTRFFGLTRGGRWSIALIATDHSGLSSPISNVVAAIVPIGGALHDHAGVALAPRGRPSGLPLAIDWQGAAEAVGSAQSLAIHDLSGRVVLRVPLGGAAGGTFTWDGRDGEGRLVPAGLYFARLSSGAFHAETRLVLLP